VLSSAQERGLIGPGPLAPHLDRSLQMGALVPPGAARALDLGSGGGLPGLPLALALPALSWVLLDGSVSRARFLQEAVRRLGLAERVQVVASRAEEAGRGALRASFDVVMARSFGPPAVTAECGAPFLVVGGRLVIAEPPASEGGERWPAAPLAGLGLVPGQRVESPSAFQVLEQRSLCPDRYPRRNGIPAKRPLF
jgi:16S rRNA (guanine527-N7)-methyltransferase